MAASGIFPLTAQPAISGFQKEESEPKPVAVSCATPDYAEEHCAHSFLVTDRDNKGNVYWCKICDERFSAYFQSPEKNHGTRFPGARSF